MARVKISSSVQQQVLVASHRRCCLCYFLSDVKTERRGQLAHVDRDASNSKFENLVFLCLEHHDIYDGRTSQSKGFTEGEVRHWRDELYAKFPKSDAMLSDAFKEDEGREISTVSSYDKIIRRPSSNLGFLRRPWRYSLWQVANKPEYFAYKARNGCDGVCLIERINLPDGRIVIVCIQTIANPGMSITNCVETLVFQVCERFEIPADKLVWLEHYDSRHHDEWNWVTFKVQPPRGLFADPSWEPMTKAMWEDLRLRPKKRMRVTWDELESKVTKRFSWPVEALLD